MVGTIRPPRCWRQAGVRRFARGGRPNGSAPLAHVSARRLSDQACGKGDLRAMTLARFAAARLRTCPHAQRLARFAPRNRGRDVLAADCARAADHVRHGRHAGAVVAAFIPSELRTFFQNVNVGTRGTNRVFHPDVQRIGDAVESSCATPAAALRQVPAFVFTTASHQADAGPSRKHGGPGLRLAIVRAWWSSTAARPARTATGSIRARRSWCGCPRRRATRFQACRAIARRSPPLVRPSRWIAHSRAA